MRGAAAELSRRTGVPAPMISQVLNEKTHQGGKKRLIGDETARKLERGMNRDKGWMDVAHNSPMSERDAETLGSLQALTDDQRRLIEGQIAEFARLNRSSGAAAPSADQAPKRSH